MKAALGLTVVLLAGCATSFRTDPSKIVVTVEPPTAICGASDNEVHPIVRIENKGRSNFGIWVLGPQGPPFEFSWLSYQVLNDAGEVSVDHGPGGHGPMPPSTLRISPGDSTLVVAPIYALNLGSHTAKYAIRIEDEDKNIYTTAQFSPCVAP